MGERRGKPFDNPVVREKELKEDLMPISEVAHRRAHKVWEDFLLTGVGLGVNELEGFGTQRWEKGQVTK